MARDKNEWLEWLKALLIAGLLAFVVRMFLFTPIVVDGPSMQPTLHDGDRLIVNKFSYLIGEPDRFDIVVFNATLEEDYIKRVIGLPGDQVEVKDDKLYINGKQIDEPFLNDTLNKLGENQRYTNNFTIEDIPNGKSEVPEDSVLVLGDNRSNSTDSRMLGFISYDRLVGKASFQYWPLDRIQLIK
ncbi:signal peptidase I [Aquibacillus sp. 3ASR75-11]|uniref:Signal peptidase I n=1 Tax=Terrihalobacillus insolitus TaxID=2950438 RepID=A0A9X3WP76_9BACI|nr:signal peptidase I [Terrihalobacillus insolitus]MDC3414155.1 signal peptidase I [Terrihalobacillus insolitus]MDC3423597.1 signal peptidase I [Terrihalobacillus insolitus]